MEDIHRQAFRDEATDLLAELESALLELDESPGDSELVNRIFRAMHTLKGSGAMFGFDDIAQFTHEVETVFDKVRGGELDVSRTLLDLTFQAKDHVKLLLENDGGDLGGFLAQGTALLAGFRQLAASCAPRRRSRRKGPRPYPASRRTMQASSASASNPARTSTPRATPRNSCWTT